MPEVRWGQIQKGPRETRESGMGGVEEWGCLGLGELGLQGFRAIVKWICRGVVISDNVWHNGFEDFGLSYGD